jgi:RNA polymerase sigma-70 factor, ECF subfamily
MDFSDMHLITMVVQNNDHRAYGKLVSKYQSDVRGLLRRLTNGNMTLSDDLAQEVFIRAFIYLKSFKAASSFSTWLYRISYNVFIDNRKSIKHTEDIDGHDFISDENKDIDSTIDLQNALRILNENEKVTIVLHYEKDLSHNEIAKILHMPLGTVKTNILRGKEKLKKYYNYERKG